MKDNRWLDRGTRALIVKMTFYNGNTDSFVSASFLFEFSLGGEAR